MFAAMRRARVTRRRLNECFDLLTAVAERQSANEKEPEAAYALRVPELCLN
jgi:hypothetical protein